MSELTTEQVQEMLARAEAAPPGPWTLHEDNCGQVWVDDFPIAYCDTREQGEGPSPELFRRNAAFIAAARTDVPLLAREVLRLRALARRRICEICWQDTWMPVGEWDCELKHPHPDEPHARCECCWLQTELEKARKDSEQLRSALQDFCDEAADARTWPDLETVRARARKLLEEKP